MEEYGVKIGIVGAGWYGSHTALVLRRSGHDVTIFEKNSDIFNGISGKFGIRLHKGPHYPRSLETRKSCRRGYDEFQEQYTNLVVKHDYSIYALGTLDANGDPPKVSAEEFKLVCEESKNCQPINPKEWNYTNLISAMNVEEPSIVLGEQLRKTFKALLKEAGVKVVCNFEVKTTEKCGESITITNEQYSETFDYIINATSYHALLPTESTLSVDMDVVYQPCLALVYEDTMSTPLPFSFIVLDGWFPCIMPYLEDDRVEENKKYILTHGKWTIMGSFKTVIEATMLLNNLDNEFIDKNVRPACEKEIKRFWPPFEHRFKYFGWKGAVLAKLKTNREFRSAVTFECNRVIHIIPGKINNVFDVGREVESILAGQEIINYGNYRYVMDGVLHQGIHEITEKIDPNIRNTCTLQTYRELLCQAPSSNSKEEDASRGKRKSSAAFWATLPSSLGKQECENNTNMEFLAFRSEQEAAKLVSSMQRA
jgi:hypothetical protein